MYYKDPGSDPPNIIFPLPRKIPPFIVPPASVHHRRIHPPKIKPEHSRDKRGQVVSTEYRV